MNPSPHAYWNLLITYLRPQWQRSLLLALLLLGSITLQLLNPQILRSFIDNALGAAPLDTLLVAAAIYLVVALSSQLISVGESYIAANVGWTATNRLRADLAMHCLQLDPSFFSEHTAGELIERVDGDVATLNNFFSRFIINLFGNGLLTIGVLAMLFRIDPFIGLVLTAISIAGFVLIYSLRNFPVRFWKADRQASAELFGFIEERLAGTEDIRANGARDYVMLRLYESMRNLLQKHIKGVLAGTVTWSIAMLLVPLSMAIALALGANLYLAGNITLGTIFLIFNYTQILTQPLLQINHQIRDFQMAAAGIARILALLQTEGTIASQDRALLQAGTPRHVTLGAIGVEFEHVSFEYSASEPVLHDISFRLEPGKSLGLLGRTGSGKTTLIRLLFRLYDPAGGTIRLNGSDLRDIPLAELRRRIGMVTQDIQLFHASVRDNLTFFDRSIPDERIHQVLADLGLDAWVAGLPEGLDTKLGFGGGGLSAGQAQLLAFSRIFLQDPGLVILDEASSRLDPVTERRIEHAIDRLLQGRTAIIIAHRLATVHRANAILILEDGHISEYGSRTVLAGERDSRFAQMLQTGLQAADMPAAELELKG